MAVDRNEISIAKDINATEELSFLECHSSAILPVILIISDYVSVLLSPDEGSVGAFVPQLGMIMKATPSIVLGVHLYNLTLSNLQTAYNTEYLHSSITAGIEYVVDKNLLLVGQLSKPLRSDAIVSAGIEYAVVPDLQLRAGFRAQEQVEPSFGLGLKIDVLQFDLSMQYHSLLGVLISSGVSYSFRK